MSNHLPSLFETRQAEIQQKINRLEGEKDNVGASISAGNKRIAAIKTEIAESQREMKELNNAASREPRVTDHALLRYCERVLGADLEAMRADLLAQTGAAIAIVGSGRFPIKTPGGTATAVVRGSAIVTILTHDKDRE